MAAGERHVRGFFTPTGPAAGAAPGEPLSLDALLVRQPLATFFLTVEGDALKDRGLDAGDILVVDRSRTPREGDLTVIRGESGFAVRVLRAAAGRTDVFGVVTAAVKRFCR